MTLADIVGRTLITELPADKRLNPIDRHVRLVIHGRPPATVEAIGKWSGLHRETARKSLRKLVECGWAVKLPSSWPDDSSVRKAKRTGRRRYLVAAALPIDIENAVAAELRVIRWGVKWLGEWLMLCWLDISVAATAFINNSRPSWLKLPGSARQLELDRDYVEERVGVEFHGSQHFVAGGPYARSQTDVNRQIEIDCFKIGACQRNRYRLIEMTKDDLHADKIIDKVNGVLPRAYYRADGPIFDALTELSASYTTHVIPDPAEQLA